MKVYVYDSGDGDIQVFSTLPRALRYARAQGFAIDPIRDATEDSDILWLLDTDGASGSITPVRVDQPD